MIKFQWFPYEMLGHNMISVGVTGKFFMTYFEVWLQIQWWLVGKKSKNACKVPYVLKRTAEESTWEFT